MQVIERLKWYQSQIKFTGFLQKKAEMGPLQNKNSSFVDELGKVMRKKRLRPLEN